MQNGRFRRGRPVAACGTRRAGGRHPLARRHPLHHHGIDRERAGKYRLANRARPEGLHPRPVPRRDPTPRFRLAGRIRGIRPAPTGAPGPGRGRPIPRADACGTSARENGGRGPQRSRGHAVAARRGISGWSDSWHCSWAGSACRARWWCSCASAARPSPCCAVSAQAPDAAGRVRARGRGDGAGRQRHRGRGRHGGTARAPATAGRIAADRCAAADLLARRGRWSGRRRVDRARLCRHAAAVGAASAATGGAAAAV